MRSMNRAGESSLDEEKENIWKVIFASSAGTLIEWYDFYIFGSLATIISVSFFPQGNPTVALLSTLATFATGFVVRPFGALFFGRMGDLIGRKYTFLVTLMIMGLSTTAIGLLPTYAMIGVFAPILLLILRLLQGLAMGGEYGGAATYVSEHAPHHRRGFYTSFIQTTASLGLFVSLGVILVTRTYLGEDEFKLWGWRIPFLLSIILVGMSFLIRRRLKESPLFAKMKASGKAAANPIRESFLIPANRRLVVLALFGVTAGQGGVFYTGQFYALYFLQTVLKLNFGTASQIIAVAILCGTPSFVFFGWLSDRIGRKSIILTGCLLAFVLYFPIYHAIVAAAGYDVNHPELGSQNPNTALLTFLIWIQVLFVGMVYGPIAAFLVELFPTRVRYTSMSLPYHIGNGVFGGLVPFIGTAMVAATGYIYAGLFFPVTIAAITFVVGCIWVRDPGNTNFENHDI
jgi:MFS family permease